ncbi:MAG: alpha-galactosidase [Ignavibacteriales bacterium]|nr:alpha-galactosidase [Ignavibacteriales bacterium]
MISLKSVVGVLLAVWCGCAFAQVSALRPTPPNSPANVEIVGNTIAIRYDGRLIFSGQIRSDSATVHQRAQVYREGNKIQQVILLTTMDWNRKIRINGTVLASEESFPCEADRPTDRASQGPLIVRNASGLGRNLRNRAIYDRQSDWVLSVDANPKVLVTPAAVKEDENSFSLEIEGYEIVLRFRPHFFQYHRGLEFFEPWNHKVWPGSVAGWISWFAFFDKVTEKDMVETADVFSSTLGPFGYDYFQMDDGYQRGNGEPELWLKPNEKFPNGLKYLADYIRSKGLKPSLWMGVGFFDGEFAGKHTDWFLRDSLGRLVTGNWIQYPLDASNDDALNGVVRPIFRGFRAQGWEYFKVDGLRHLRYEGYNANRGYFDRNKINLVDAYRRYAQTVRGEIGKDHFMLGCWGIRPELVGKPAVYRTSVIEPAKRAVPVLLTRPGQLYDVDPSRSDNLFRVDAEVSGSGPRPFDAGYTPQCFLYSLEINRPFGSWVVLGRTGGEFSEIRFTDLGLPTDQEYLVFEFWTKSLMGMFSKGFDPGKITPNYGCQLFCIRQCETHPQLIATGRHVSCGGYELKDLNWVGSTLSGTSEIVGNDAYTLYVLEPADYVYHGVQCTGAKVVTSTRHGMVREVTVLSDSSTKVTWRIEY